MSLGHEHGLVLIGLAGPMDVVNLSLSLLPGTCLFVRGISCLEVLPKLCMEEEEQVYYIHTASKGL